MVQSDFGLCCLCWRDVWFIAAPQCDQCGAPLPGTSDLPNAPCDECLTAMRPWRKGRAALVYQGLGRKLVLGLKHADRTDIVPFAAKWMARVAQDLLHDAPIIVPIPLHRRRLLQRRYNQAALLAQALGRLVHLKVCPDLLIRTKYTAMLEHISKGERFAMLNHVITVNPRHQHGLSGRRVLLVDDVMTTGATLTAATTACLEAGAADVCTITLARAIKEA